MDGAKISEKIEIVAALVNQLKDFGNGRVSAEYLPLMQRLTNQQFPIGKFISGIDLVGDPKTGVFEKEQIERWRAGRVQYFGEAPKGILKALKLHNLSTEQRDWLIAAIKKVENFNA